MTVEAPDTVTSSGSVMYVVGSSRAGLAGFDRSNIFTVVGLIELASTMSEVCARMGPVVEKPSSAANPPAAALEQLPCASSVPCAKVQAATAVSFPHCGQDADAG